MKQHKEARLSGAVFAAGVLGAAVLGGCVPAGSSGSSSGLSGGTTSAAAGGGQSGEEYFVQNVYPKIASSCGSCHASGAAGAPIYMGNDGESSYQKIKMFASIYNANSALLSKGQHAGPALTADQAAAVKSWLAIEFPNGGGGGTTAAGGGDYTGPDMAQLVAEWGKCMSRSDWHNDGMDDWSRLQTQGFGPCVGCHEIGNAGTFLNDDPDVTFDANRQDPYIYRLVVAKYDQEGKLVGLQKSTRLLDKGKLTIGFNPKDINYIHPTYTVPQALKSALENFQGATFDRLAPDNTCASPQ